MLVKNVRDYGGCERGSVQGIGLEGKKEEAIEAHTLNWKSSEGFHISSTQSVVSSSQGPPWGRKTASLPPNYSTIGQYHNTSKLGIVKTYEYINLGCQKYSIVLFHYCTVYF